MKLVKAKTLKIGDSFRLYEGEPGQKFDPNLVFGSVYLILQRKECKLINGVLIEFTLKRLDGGERIYKFQMPGEELTVFIGTNA